MTLDTISETEQDLISRAREVLPAGGFGNFAANVVISHGKAGRVWDESGNEYVDFLLGSGPMLVGHGHPEVLAAVEAQLPKGFTFFANNAEGILLAEDICAAVACAEKVRYVSTGSEADMYAIRLAKAHTGRDKILKFEGGYHGMSDHALMSLAPRRLVNLPQALPDSAGISPSVQDNTIVAPFNDIDAVRALIEAHGPEIAAVIVEPLQRLIPPAPGFLEGLRTLTAEHDIVLIFDEVVTGFRLAYGGAQEKYGVVPDLCTMGKVIGGGFALAAIAGSDEIMAHFDKERVGPDLFTYQVGTLSGNPIAAVAGRVTLDILRRPGSYEKIRENGQAIMTALSENFGKAGIPLQVVGDPVLFDVVFTERPVNDYRGVFMADAARLSRFNQLMRERGILKPDSKFYISLAHDDDDIAQTVTAIAETAEIMKGD